jgi:UPF0271 protein
MMVDLNCDMGESFGAWTMGDDEHVLPSISSANVACGFHGGDPRVMDRTVEAAARLGIGIGAHPAFPDLVGFGRRDLAVSPDEAFTDVLYQVGALEGFCRRHRVPMQHVKPHGQLNNLAMTRPDLAEAIVDAVYAYDPALIMVTYGGELLRAAQLRGLRIAQEVYADRAYHQSGLLVSRKVPGSVIADPEIVVQRAVRMVVERRIESIDGGTLEIVPDTICIHGDTPGAASLAAQVRAGLEAAGVQVRPMKEVLSSR